MEVADTARTERRRRAGGDSSNCEVSSAPFYTDFASLLRGTPCHERVTGVCSHCKRFPQLRASENASPRSRIVHLKGV